MLHLRWALAQRPVSGGAGAAVGQLQQAIAHAISGCAPPSHADGCPVATDASPPQPNSTTAVCVVSQRLSACSRDAPLWPASAACYSTDAAAVVNNSSSSSSEAVGSNSAPASPLDSASGPAPDLMVPQPLPRGQSPRSPRASKQRTAPKQRPEIEVEILKTTTAEALHKLVFAEAKDLEPEALRLALNRTALMMREAEGAAGQGGGGDRQQESALLSDILVRLTTQLVQVYPTLSVHQMSCVLHDYARLGLLPGTAEFAEKLAGSLSGRLDARGVDGRSLAMLTWALAKLGCSDEKLLEELSRAAERRADGMAPAQLRQMLWAAATLPLHDWQLIATLVRAAARQAPAMDPSTLATVMWAVASLQHFDSELCDMAAAAALRRLPEFRGPHVAMMCWAFGQLRYINPEFFAAVAEEMASRPGELEPRHLSQIAWAYSVRKVYHPTLFDALAARAVEVAPQLEPQHVSNIAHAFGKAGHRSDRLVAALSDVTVTKAASFAPQNLTLTAWGLAQLAAQQPEAMEAIAREAARRQLQGFNTQNLSDLAWALSATGYRDADLFDQIAAAAAPAASEASSRSITDLAWAFASAGHAAPALFTALTSAAAPRLEQGYGLGMLSDLLWSCAAIGHRDDAFLDAAARVLPRFIGLLAGDQEAQAKILWALKSLGYRNTDLEAVLKAAIGVDLDTLLGAEQGEQAAAQPASASPAEHGTQ